MSVIGLELGIGLALCFYRAALNAGRSGTRKVSVCPSVCLSVYQTLHCDKTGERSVQIFISYEKSFSLVF